MEEQETFFPLYLHVFLNFPSPPLTHITPSHPSRWLSLIISCPGSFPLWPEQAQVVLGHPTCLSTSFHRGKSWIHCSISALSTGSPLPHRFHFSPLFSPSSQLAFSSPREYMKLAPSSVCLPLLGPLSERGVPQVWHFLSSPRTSLA